MIDKLLVYVAQSVSFIVMGQVPLIVTLSGHPTNVVFALDLTLLIPWLALGAVWLMKCRPWGYVIAGILIVLSSSYTRSYTLFSGFMSLNRLSNMLSGAWLPGGATPPGDKSGSSIFPPRPRW